LPRFGQRHVSVRFSNCLPIDKSAIIERRIQRSRRRERGEAGGNGKVTERTDADRPVRGNPGLRGSLIARGGPFLMVAIGVLLVVGGTIAGFVFGRFLAYRDLPAARAMILQQRTENQKLQGATNELNVQLAEQQRKYTEVHNTLEAIMPSESRYNISPNQSMIVGGGHLTIGLVGAPTNDSVNININGKQQSMATGDVIKITPDPATACQVAVQSFDMFTAALTASCTAVKPQ
jgi:hypothetical protein